MLMSRELSMMSRRKITKKFAREYAKAGKVEKGRLLLNELWDLMMARKNHLLPCVKAIDWT